jgi:hypothetical protein
MGKLPAMTDQELPTPVITAATRAAARQHPGGWLYEIDPFFDPDGDVPPHGVRGAWKVDEEGEITGEFQASPNYLPSPVALGFPHPTDELDARIQLAATGYGDDAAVRAALVEAELLTPAGPDDSIAIYPDEGVSAAFVFSSEAHLPTRQLPESTGWQRVSGRELVKSLPEDTIIIVNVGSAAKVRIPCRDLQPTTG